MATTTSNSTSTYRCTKANVPPCQRPTLKESQRRQRDCRTHLTSPRAMRIAVRDAGCRQPEARATTKPLVAQPGHMANWRDSEPTFRVSIPAQASPSQTPTSPEASHTQATAVRCCRTSFPCASPASSSCWAGLRSACIYYVTYITLRFVNFRKEKYILLFVNFR